MSIIRWLLKSIQSLWLHLVGYFDLKEQEKSTDEEEVDDKEEEVDDKEKEVDDKEKEVAKPPFLREVYLVGYVPCDLDFFVYPFKAGTSWLFKRFGQMVEILSKAGVNATRFFSYCQEDANSSSEYIQPLRQIGGRYVFDYEDGKIVVNLTKRYKDEIHRRLECFHKRGITTIICLASGVKGFRYKWTMWSANKSNLKGASDSVEDFLLNAEVKRAFKAYAKALVKEFDSELVIWELINEPQGIVRHRDKYQVWVNDIVKFLLQLGVPLNRIMIESSGTSIDLKFLAGYRHFLYSYHGINTKWAFERFHRKGVEMQEYFYKPYGKRIIADSDGAQTWDKRLVGKGLKGYSWNKEFTRPATKDMMEGLIYDFRQGGGGWIIMSAAAWVEESTCPNLNLWERIVVQGLTEAQCAKYGVSYEDNSMPEMEAIKRAVNRIKTLYESQK